MPGRDGPIPVSVSEISAYRHFFQYRQYRYRQAKKCADTAALSIGIGIGGIGSIGGIGKGQYRHIGVSAKMWYRPIPT